MKILIMVLLLTIGTAHADITDDMFEQSMLCTEVVGKPTMDDVCGDVLQFVEDNMKEARQVMSKETDEYTRRTQEFNLQATSNTLKLWGLLKN